MDSSLLRALTPLPTASLTPPLFDGRAADERGLETELRRLVCVYININKYTYIYSTPPLLDGIHIFLICMYVCMYVYIYERERVIDGRAADERGLETELRRLVYI